MSAQPFLPVMDLDPDVFVFHVTKHTMSMYAGQTFWAERFDPDFQCYTGMVTNPRNRYDDCSAFAARELYPVESGGIVQKHWFHALRVSEHETEARYLHEGDYVDVYDEGHWFPIDQIRPTLVGNTGEPILVLRMLDQSRDKFIRPTERIKVLRTDEALTREWVEAWWMSAEIHEHAQAEYRYERMLYRHHVWEPQQRART